MTNHAHTTDDTTRIGAAIHAAFGALKTISIDGAVYNIAVGFNVVGPNGKNRYSATYDFKANETTCSIVLGFDVEDDRVYLRSEHTRVSIEDTSAVASILQTQLSTAIRAKAR